ncbi:hypothetical protein AVEN_179680-1 [Araneus ventricosus]|uniref:Uncharacterized protein n=1 Tax=Araneus ventricosus TaxID=182803 RepID=A0A4Y2QVK1_ARAVE|nr:hypothetical protein AVEN_179680-1 [Araneus ventricosus]
MVNFGRTDNIQSPQVLLCCLIVAGVVALGGMGDERLEFFSWQGHPRREEHSIIPSIGYYTNLLQTICSHVWSWRRGTSLKVLRWFVIFCGRADSWT